MDMEWLTNADLVIGCHNKAKFLINGATANWTLVDSSRAAQVTQPAKTYVRGWLGPVTPILKARIPCTEGPCYSTPPNQYWLR